MTALVFFLLLIGSLFALSYVTKRRFGVLGLSLAAGSLLSINWAGTLTPFIQQQGVELAAPPLDTVVRASLVLLPPLLLFFSGPAYQSGWPRFFGAVGFSVLAFAFLLQPLGDAIQLDGGGLTLYSFFQDYQSLIIVCGLIGAIVDVLLTRKNSSKKSAH